MRRAFRTIGTALFFLAVALCFAPVLIPPFLDRIYYDGPISGHYDGERFFNPGGDPPESNRTRSFIGRWLTGDRSEWPEHVPVRRTVPPRGVDGDAMRVTWIGHATVLVQTAGLNILTDPIWSERASPFAFAGPKRVRAPGVRFKDLPEIDLVLVSHNHYDHMDLPTLKRLWERDRPLIVTSPGNDTILRNEGIGSHPLDWGESIGLGPAEVRVDRNHHWSSRWGTDRNRALWSAFTVALPGGNIFFAGDTGYGDGSWVREAAARGPYRLALIPIGAYEPRDFMKEHHVNPEEAMRIFEALNPAAALGIHWGTFQLTFEPIDEPRQKLQALKQTLNLHPRRFLAIEAGESFAVPAE